MFGRETWTRAPGGAQCYMAGCPREGPISRRMVNRRRRDGARGAGPGNSGISAQAGGDIDLTSNKQSVLCQGEAPEFLPAPCFRLLL